MLFLLPLFIYSQWFLSYQSTFTATYHSLRGRALIGFLSSVFGLAGTFTSGSLLDVTSISRPKKFRALFLAIYTIYTSFWIGVTVVQWHYSKTHPIGLDWTDGEYYASFIFLLLWGSVFHDLAVGHMTSIIDSRLALSTMPFRYICTRWLGRLVKTLTH